MAKPNFSAKPFIVGKMHRSGAHFALNNQGEVELYLKFVGPPLEQLLHPCPPAASTCHHFLMFCAF